MGAAEMTKCQGSWSLHPGLEPFGLGKVIDFLGGSEHGGEGLGAMGEFLVSSQEHTILLFPFLTYFTECDRL